MTSPGIFWPPVEVSIALLDKETLNPYRFLETSTIAVGVAVVMVVAVPTVSAGGKVASGMQPGMVGCVTIFSESRTRCIPGYACTVAG